MNHCVPEYNNMEGDYPNPSSSGTPSTSQPNKPSTADEDIMELLWHNGQLVMQNQSQRLPKTSSPLAQSSSQQQNQHQQLFMHEDEMCSWLHYPLVEDSSSFEHNFCADLLYPPPPSSSLHTTTTSTVTETVASATVPIRTTHVSISEPKPPPNSSESSARGLLARQSMPPPLMGREGPESEPSVQNLGLFPRYKARLDSCKGAVLGDTVVDSSDTPSIEMEAARQKRVEGGKNVVCGFVGTGGSSAGGERVVGETSSPGGSSASGEQGQKQPVEDRKRKGIEAEDAEGQSEDVESESADTKKHARGSTSNKRSRAAEVHNLSERRRRDRINEKMKALQDMIPRCNKTDKASMLDEAIDYLKALQMQVQMMSMGFGMVPVIYPGMQQYMQPMGMGVGMGMSMEMSMNRPMMPYPLPSPAFPASAHMGPRYPLPLPPFPMPHTPVQDPSWFQTNQPDLTLNTGGAPNPISPRVPLYMDPYQQYPGPQQMQVTLQQNQVVSMPSTSKPGPSGGVDHADHPKSG